MYTFNKFNDKPAGAHSLTTSRKATVHEEFNDEPEGDRVFESTEKHRRLADRR